MTVDTTRFEDLLPKDVLDAIGSVTIIGSGGIGSVGAEVVCRMGIPRVHLIDFDEVDPVNVATQNFFHRDVGKNKAEVIAERLGGGLGTEVTADTRRVVAGDTFKSRVVFSAVDSMEARKIIFNGFLASHGAEFLIDGRMGALIGQVHAISKADHLAVCGYEKTLYSDEEAHVAPCTQKATTFCPYFLNGLVGGMMRKLFLGETYDFYIDFDLDGMKMSRCMY